MNKSPTKLLDNLCTLLEENANNSPLARKALSNEDLASWWERRKERKRAEARGLISWWEPQ